MNWDLMLWLVNVHGCKAGSGIFLHLYGCLGVMEMVRSVSCSSRTGWISSLLDSHMFHPDCFLGLGMDREVTKVMCSRVQLQCCLLPSHILRKLF